jgi:hypothetical protein
VTFGASICSKSSFFGAGALSSNGAKRSGCTNGDVSTPACVGTFRPYGISKAANFSGGTKAKKQTRLKKC